MLTGIAFMTALLTAADPCTPEINQAQCVASAPAENCADNMRLVSATKRRTMTTREPTPLAGVSRQPVIKYVEPAGSGYDEPSYRVAKRQPDRSAPAAAGAQPEVGGAAPEVIPPGIMQASPYGNGGFGAGTYGAGPYDSGAYGPGGFSSGGFGPGPGFHGTPYYGDEPVADVYDRPPLRRRPPPTWPPKSPGNMMQHIPYKHKYSEYYYFRPYNWFHIAEHQSEVLNYGGDPRNPYDNKIFLDVYRDLKPGYPAGHPAVIAPPASRGQAEVDRANSAAEGT